MIPFKNLQRAAGIAAALLICSTSILAQGLNAPQDTSNAISRYELLAVRLGMFETDYPHSSPQETSFIVANNNSISGQPGPPAVEGVGLYQGRCLGLPFSRSSGEDSMKLEPDCNRVFNMGYQPQIKNGVKLLASGRAQLIDLEAGRAFVSWMATGAGNLYNDKPKTSDSKL